jgi:hypothetical protein
VLRSVEDKQTFQQYILYMKSKLCNKFNEYFHVGGCHIFTKCFSPYKIYHMMQLMRISSMSQPHFEGSVRSPLTLPKWGLGNPPRFPNVQNSISEVKTPHLEVFFIPLERSWNVDVENGLVWAIRTSAALVRAGGVQYTVGKLSRRATSLL